MNWLSLVRSTLAAGRRLVKARGDALDSGTRPGPHANAAPNSTFGYGALVIGNSRKPSHRAH